MNAFEYIKQNYELVKDRNAITINDETISYRSLFKGIYNVEEILYAYIKKRDIVCLIYDNSIETLYIFFSLLKNDVIVIPIYSNNNVNEISNIIKISSPKIIVSHNSSYEITEYLRTHFSNMYNNCTELGEKVKVYQNNNYIQRIESDESRLRDAATIMFTSGSTGEITRGIISCNKRLIDASNVNIEMFNWNISDSIKMFICSNMLSPLSIAGYLLPALNLGQNVLFVNNIFNDIELAGVLKHEINTLIIRPSFLKRFLGNVSIEHTKLSSVENCFLTGENIEKTFLNHLISNYSFNLYNFYGSTETFCISYTCDKDSIEVRNNTVGRLCPNVDIKLKNKIKINTSNECGEICIRSPYILNGYYEKDNIIIRKQDSYIDTGDIGFVDDSGYLKVIGRKFNLIMKENDICFCEEIENKIKDIFKISECIVSNIQEYDKIILWIERGCIDKNFDFQEFYMTLSNNINRKFSPDYIIYSNTVKIIRTANGKIDRKNMQIKIKEIYEDKLLNNKANLCNDKHIII